MKFAHIADTHIRNLKYHEEYKAVFAKMYETLREEKVDYIVHCGDIAHTKTQISPEFVEMAANFFKSLADIAPTYVILGNHDGNLKNDNRQDAITPIVDALQHNNLHLLKNAEQHDIGNGFCLNVLSVFDEENWTQPEDTSKINIALYHGAISGVTTDTGWVMDHGEHDIEIFKDHDFAFLGDIHKTNQILDTEGRVRYPGSTIQQNHGETNDKGFLLWDIQSKDDFTCKHVQIDNPKPFITVELTKSGRLPKNTKIVEGARLRLVCNHSIPLDKLRKAVDVAKTKFQPSSITFLNKAIDKGSVSDVTGELVQEDLRDTAVQEGLIKKFLKDYDVNSETLSRVHELNKKYNIIAEENETVKRNINWRLKTLEWDNLFNYGEGNKVDFTDLAGIVGIFGKNFSGKSSIIDSLLYTLYNTTSKGNRKNLNTINQDKEWGRGKVEIEIGDNTLTVERRSEKYVKRLKGEETVEAKTDVDFYVTNSVTGEVESLNGLDRNGTDKNIRKFFGTSEDFFLTSMASQLDSLSFIGEGSTKRKEILAKFLDLEIFERKYKLAKEDASELRSNLKRLEEIDFEQVIQEHKDSLSANQQEVETQEAACRLLKVQIESANKELKDIESSIESIPAKVIDVVKVTNQRDAALLTVENIEGTNRQLGKTAKSSREFIQKADSFLSSFDLDGLREKQDSIHVMQGLIEKAEKEKATHEKDLQRCERKSDLLEQHEYDPDCDFCSNNEFVKDAQDAKSRVPVLISTLETVEQALSTKRAELASLEPEQVAEHLDKYEKLIKKRSEKESELKNADLDIAKNKNQIIRLKSDVKEYTRQIEEYEQNREAIENLEALLSEKEALSSWVSDQGKELQACEQKVMNLYKENGSLEQKLSDAHAKQDELEQCRQNYAAHDLYEKCMHSNGISLDIIKNKLPVLNEEIASVLANVVDFEVFLQCDTKHLELFIKHPKYDARPLEMGSGAEKTIAAMAIRLALLNVSSMPKGDTFILDEPGTALDEENMEGFVRILDMVKAHFKTVLLISHLDSLKDASDSQIAIEKKKGFAFVNQ